jgi:type I restriction enzyme S subunit
MDIAIPSLLLIQRFTDMVQPLFRKAALHTDESRTLAALRDTLLPKLLSGELRVEEAARFVQRSV